MSLSSSVAFHIASGCICAVLILVRSLYRILSRCHVHKSCYRRWRLDDTYMALALLPLAGRTTCVSLAFVFNPSSATTPATAAQAAAQNMSIAQLDRLRVIALKLHIPARIFYALLYSTLLPPASQLVLDSDSLRQSLDAEALPAHILRPLRQHLAQRRAGHQNSMVVNRSQPLRCHDYRFCRMPATSSRLRVWDLQTEKNFPTCRRALANLITMAVCNALTNIALVVLPFPILRHMKLSRKSQIQLGFLFGIGAVVVVIPIIRIPVTLATAVTQSVRSLWGSIEILCSCIVANTAFFYSIAKDLAHQHDDRAPRTSALRQDDFYLQSLPSSSSHSNGAQPQPATGQAQVSAK
ncbi:Uncharacterized protein TPAR_03109 [Tolypocladium paradoxum]|uniref:Rhodopsin domain-containing protein n=1 Tax=Tolypocladium paradoxum TaxID=94208 RepID=A0A2S4L2N3_9HYPO|nr:Uncharacterized protein TPAR_03109 [Tolypocladium paradoxum]